MFVVGALAPLLAYQVAFFKAEDFMESREQPSEQLREEMLSIEWEEKISCL